MEFRLEQVQDLNTGALVDTLVMYSGDTREEWCNTIDLNNLFTACSNKWGTNWNLEKVIVAIEESDIE